MSITGVAAETHQEHPHLQAGHPQASPQEIPNLSQANTHKLLGNCLVPRERYLRKQLDAFLQDVYRNAKVTVVGYQGLKSLLEIEKVKSFTQIKNDLITNLVLFALGRFELMGNWHEKILLNDAYLLTRCLAIQVAGETAGAIEFTINLKSKKCTLDLLEIDENQQRKHLGTILLHSAIMIALCYECYTVECHATFNAIGFYEKNGFCLQSRNGLHVLKFSDAASREKLLSKVQLTAPSFALQSWLDAVSLERPVEAASEGGETPLPYADEFYPMFSLNEETLIPLVPVSPPIAYQPDPWDDSLLFGNEGLCLTPYFDFNSLQNTDNDFLGLDDSVEAPDKKRRKLNDFEESDKARHQSPQL